jgi:hypothetical protein
MDLLTTLILMTWQVIMFGAMFAIPIMFLMFMTRRVGRSARKTVRVFRK